MTCYRYFFSVTKTAREVFERSQLDLHWESNLKDLTEPSQQWWLFLTDVSNAPQKRCFFCDALKAFQIYLKKAWDEFHFYLSRKYCRTLVSLQFILTSFVKVIIFGFCFWKHILNSVTVNKWKSERRISKTVL